mmetsp:Transcript_37637/g.82428  ORF Transcript_37637/g.82428 Transcript_37637/m.82428 type:complete len:357 (+) Transcript_37637:154-1224(+)|eukprot:CAMPEP_0178543288 /NCGR_PEP_ID=MMETSP0697-20121206/2507_1 /TAXON_ID=265572 /ORGANISM="Extubocellulus spinifer, Strain CCMP396" /LENGTH=356 /DNA_ID=CAMNT_0020175735 /DNA_START=62 /DNA_END=1132 /DNA_ORIENTATION=-
MPSRKKRSKKSKARQNTGSGSNGMTTESTGTSQLEEPLLPSPPTSDDIEAGTSKVSGSGGGGDGDGGGGGPSKSESVENFIGDVNVVEATLISDAQEFNTSFEAPPSSSSRVHGDTVQITAPATLPGGFTFVATLDDGRAFTVITPDGGVLNGDVMEVPFPTTFLATTVVPPNGQWKDGILDCCGLGCFHPVLWISWLCPLVGIGQVNTRMRLTWLGTRATARQVGSTFAVLVAITLINFVVTNVLNYLGHRYGGSNIDNIYYRIGSTFSLCVMLFRVYSIATTRRKVRKKYDIPPSACARGCCCGCCRSCDDLCAALLCSCCSTAQMLRHTADYETYRSVCCSSNGLPANAPVVV